MQTTAHYHLVLHAGADADAFEALYADNAMDGVIQPTRITSGFDTRLLRSADDPTDGDSALPAGRRYVWEVNVTLVTDKGYDFGRNVEGLQAGVADLATVYRLESFTPVGR